MQPQTTAPPEVVTIKIMISDNAIHLSPKAAPRGDMARFILVNSGKKPHTFSLGHQHRQTGSQTGFVRSLAPGAQHVLILFLDYRGTLPYLGTLPADRTKPAMKGTFKIT
ncbi:MAG: Cupredoxin-like domain [Gaiellaceae bacterium]|nr:Cupredoxin-like domain [Gaiellaceae bacterium]